MERCGKLAIHTERSMAGVPEPGGELAETASGIENAGTRREDQRGEDQVEPMEVTRPEHLGLRPPLVRFLSPLAGRGNAKRG